LSKTMGDLSFYLEEHEEYEVCSVCFSPLSIIL
jgi:hypothetical protein